MLGFDFFGKKLNQKNAERYLKRKAMDSTANFMRKPRHGRVSSHTTTRYVLKCMDGPALARVIKARGIAYNSQAWQQMMASLGRYCRLKRMPAKKGNPFSLTSDDIQ